MTEDSTILKGIDRLIEKMERAIRYIAELNAELERLAARISEAQLARPGSITLHLYDCGPKCAGCPHPTWRKWRARPVALSHRQRHGRGSMLVASEISQPLRHLRSPAHSEEFRELVRRAVAIQRERKELLERFSGLYQSALKRRQRRYGDFEEN